MGRNHACFSTRVTRAAKFLRMPATARLLYYDCIGGADDDGIVEAYTLLLSTGATSGDIQTLIDHGYITVLSQEDVLLYLPDWREHNIGQRADRKVNSIHLPLLLRVVPDAPVLMARQRADRKKNKEDVLGTSLGRPVATLKQHNTIQHNQKQHNNIVGRDEEQPSALTELINNLSTQYSTNYVSDKLELLRSAERSKKITNPCGWLRRACEDDWRGATAADILEVKANPDCPHCHGSGRAKRRIGDDGPIIEIECDCVRRQK